MTATAPPYAGSRSLLQLTPEGRWSFAAPLQDPLWQLACRSGRQRGLVEAWVEERIAEQVTLDAEPEQPADALAARLLRFKQASFTLLVEERFSRTKRQRDLLIYSLLRSRQRGRVEELALAIREGALEFAQAAIRWSEGPESGSGGRIGPIAPGVSHPDLNERLERAAEGDLIGPFPVGDMFVLLRLDTRITTRLTAELQAQIVEELYREWLDRQLDALLAGESIPPIEYLPE